MHDAAQALKTSPEKTEEALQKVPGAASGCSERPCVRPCGQSLRPVPKGPSHQLALSGPRQGSPVTGGGGEDEAGAGGAV